MDTKMKTGAPMVSVGLPVYNGERYLDEALESILGQTYSDFEVIISDNASSDTTQEICRQFLQRDDRIRYIRQDRNFGAPTNFNAVVKDARGELFTWLAHDDILAPQFLEKGVEYLLQNPVAVLVTGDFVLIDEDGVEFGVERLDRIRDEIPWERRRVAFFEYPSSNVYFSLYGLMRTDLCKKIMQATKEPKFLTGSELPPLSRFAVAGEISSIPFLLRRYRRHHSSAFMTEFAEKSKGSKVRFNIFEFGNIRRIQFDQIRTLMLSGLPTKTKWKIFSRMLFMDARYIHSKLVKLVKKTF